MMSEVKNWKDYSRGWTARSNKTLTDNETHAVLLSFYLSALYLSFKCYCRGTWLSTNTSLRALAEIKLKKRSKKKKKSRLLQSLFLNTINAMHRFIVGNCQNIYLWLGLMVGNFVHLWLWMSSTHDFSDGTWNCACQWTLPSPLPHLDSNRVQLIIKGKQNMDRTAEMQPRVLLRGNGVSAAPARKGSKSCWEAERLQHPSVASALSQRRQANGRGGKCTSL